MPTKVIVVCGKPKSGKSTAIRNVLAQVTKGLSKTRGEVRVIVQIRRKRRTITVGIGSSGDTPFWVQDNFNFFRPYKGLDIIICASRAKGTVSHGEVLKQARRLGSKKIVEVTSHAKTGAQAIRIENARVVREILKNVP